MREPDPFDLVCVQITRAARAAYGARCGLVNDAEALPWGDLPDETRSGFVGLTMQIIDLLPFDGSVADAHNVMAENLRADGWAPADADCPSQRHTVRALWWDETPAAYRSAWAVEFGVVAALSEMIDMDAYAQFCERIESGQDPMTAQMAPMSASVH